MVKRFGNIEEVIRTGEQGEKIQRKNLTLPVLVRVRDDSPGVLATSESPLTNHPVLNNQIDSKNANEPLYHTSL